MHGLSRDLVDRGLAAWNIEYRRVGSNGGDPLQTLADVAAAIDLLTVLEVEHRLDVGRVAFVGHSAGGHLALWAGGAELAVTPSIVIGQAAVSDLMRAAVERLGNGAAQDFCGGEPDEVADRYAAAQPRLDADLVHLVHGDDDDTVPPAHSVEAVAVDGRSVPHTIVAGADHMAVIDPGSKAWAVQVDLLEHALAPGS
jgi:acetyl esterase/lipase